MNGTCQSVGSVDDLLNGMLHMADDHPCCRGTIELAIAYITLLRDKHRAAVLKIAQLKGLHHPPNDPAHLQGRSEAEEL